MLPTDSRRSRRWQMGGASSASAARLIAVSIRPRSGLGVRTLTKLCAVMTLIYCAMQQQIPMSSVIDSAQEERLTRSCRVTSPNHRERVASELPRGQEQARDEKPVASVSPVGVTPVVAPPGLRTPKQPRPIQPAAPPSNQDFFGFSAPGQVQ